MEQENIKEIKTRLYSQVIDGQYEFEEMVLNYINELESENKKYKRKLTTNQWVREIRKETAKEILKMFNDRNYITEQDLKNAIAKRFGFEGETWQ